MPVIYADGAFVILHRAVLESGLCFDSSLFLYYDDVDLSLKAWSYGIPSFLLPIIIGEHYRSTTTSKNKPLQLYVQIRNRLYIACRYIGITGLIYALLWYIFYPFRLLDRLNIITKRVLEEMGLTKIVRFEIDRKTIVPLARIATRAIADAAKMIYHRRKWFHRVHRHACVLHLSLIDMMSTKKLLVAMQQRLQEMLSKH